VALSTTFSTTLSRSNDQVGKLTETCLNCLRKRRVVEAEPKLVFFQNRRQRVYKGY